MTSMHGLLLIDKDSGLSSHAVVSKVRRALQTRAVGHAGTLDPMATGLLVLGIGEGTKLLHYLTGHDKQYAAAVHLGLATDSWDADGQIVQERPVAAMDQSDIGRIAQRFVGTFEQRAPAVSAIKLGGEALYKKVRRGETVDAPSRSVTVHRLDVLQVELPRFMLRVSCAKGFYVRSLAHDLGVALGTVAHLCALRRERSGPFTVAEAVRFSLLQAAAAGDEAARLQLRQEVWPLSRALEVLPIVRLDSAGAEHARHGRPIPSVHVVGVKGEPPGDEQPLGLLSADGDPLAIAVQRSRQLHVVRGFRLA